MNKIKSSITGIVAVSALCAAIFASAGCNTTQTNPNPTTTTNPSPGPSTMPSQMP
ncbi:MAG TPA: hypothetical protein VKT51_06155 [Candidatus Eremiobacteraceae bacterium]|nr:hypothetical protein [Candidatus Eremiobacteraceae bacterium]